MTKNVLVYKGVKVSNLGLPLFNSFKKEQENKYSKKRNPYKITFSNHFKNDSPKNLIVMYDIPHNMKVERDWFRRHLIKFGYIMIQKSVWVGPSPLPKASFYI